MIFLPSVQQWDRAVYKWPLFLYQPDILAFCFAGLERQDLRWHRVADAVNYQLRIRYGTSMHYSSCVTLSIWNMRQHWYPNLSAPNTLENILLDVIFNIHLFVVIYYVSYILWSSTQDICVFLSFRHASCALCVLIKCKVIKFHFLPHPSFSMVKCSSLYSVGPSSTTNSWYR